MKLNLGAGYDYRKDWTNVDLYYPTADLQEDVAELPSIKVNTVEEIMALHVLEHLPAARGRVAMRRWWEVLQLGGKIMLVIPDVVVTIRRWLEAYESGTPNVWNFRSHGIWGDQTEPGQFHMWGYDTQSLVKLMMDSGFTQIVTEPFEGFDGDLGQLLPDLCILARAVKE